ncbi:multicopper oxidase domain-containing protein [Nocardia brasiliensis]|uniref:Multicopper oxidase domain-containing protein n=1 Tax=Nocardia brasiliensis TaxID=37326 RepID=A0A6G9XTX5_NOCBR|nr:multicopper oxidase domain-containing protein [Nocardia brasiliensis]QIS04358.1 multicopper oxidase domain-containing protein [Nocardia brasiliensis]
MTARREALRLLAGAISGGLFHNGCGYGLVAAADVIPLPPGPFPLPGLPPPPVSAIGLRTPPLQPFLDSLPVPESIAADGALAVQSGLHRFHIELAPARTLGYGRDYLGPVLEAIAGEEASLSFSNEIGPHPLAADVDTTMQHATEHDRTNPRMTVHLHGAPTEPASDGHPLVDWRNGGTQKNTYGNRQEAATLWYHDHAMGMTRLNVYAGLAGAYLIRDRWDTGRFGNPLGLPAGEFEVPLVIQDRTFNPDGTLQARSTFLLPQGYNQAAMFGDVACVNGIVWPMMKVARGLYRFRIVQASNSRTYRFHFSNGMRFWVVGGDQGLLDAPVPTKSIRLGVGERADILVDFGDLRPGESVDLCNDEANSFGDAVFLVPALPTIMRFVADSSRGHAGPVPKLLRGAAGLPPRLPGLRTPDRVRTMTLLSHLDTARPGAVIPAMLSQNNLPFTTDDVEMIRPGTVEQWDIVNVTSIGHPVHLHLARFRIIGRQQFWAAAYLGAHLPLPAFGKRWNPSADRFVVAPQQPPAPWEEGWKDTVWVPTDTITRILVYWPSAEELGFDPDAPFLATADIEFSKHTMEHIRHPTPHHHRSPGKLIRGYVWHCHNLDHEDHDMMLPFRVTND